MSRSLSRGMFRNVVDGGGEPSTASLTIQFEDATGGTLPHRIYLDGILAETLDAGDTEHTITGLDWNTEYTVSIFSFDDPTESNELTVDIWTAPASTPTGLAANATGETSINLTWNLLAEEPASVGGGYELEISTNAGADWSALTTVLSSIDEYDATGLDSDTTYHFRIRAFNANPSPHDNGVTAWSTAVSETTDADVTGPTLSAVSATPGDTTASLTMTSSETGNVWWSITTNATETAAAIKAGTGAVDYDTSACTAGVAVTPTATGLTNGVEYFLHVVAEDVLSNQSDVSNTAGFVPAAPSITYLFEDNFEGTGAPTGYTDTNGSPDYDYTATVLEGSQSLALLGKTAAATQGVQRDFTPTAGEPLEYYFMFRFPQIATTNNRTFILGGTTVNARFVLKINSAETPVIQALGGSDAAGVEAFAPNTTYHGWIRFVKGSGSNAFASFGWSTDGTRPTSGDRYMESTNGTGTTDVNRISTYGDYNTASNAYDVIIDKVKASHESIGNNP